MANLWNRLCRQHGDTPKLPRESPELLSVTSALNGDWTRWPSEIHSYLEFLGVCIACYFRFLFCRPLFPQQNHSQGQILQEHDVLINTCMLARANPPWKGSDFYCLRQARALLLNLQYFLILGFLVVLFKLCVKSLWAFILYRKKTPFDISLSEKLERAMQNDHWSNISCRKQLLVLLHNFG